MNLWGANIQILRTQYPGLAEGLAGQHSEDPLEGDMRIETAASGDPTLVIRGVHIHSPRDPAREGRRLAESLGGEGPLIILGFGLGYAAEAAAAKNPGRIFVVVERHPAILRRALETRDLGKFLVNHKLIFILGGDSGGIAGALRLLEGEPELLKNRALITMDEAWYGEVEGQIRGWAAREDVNMATLRRFGKRWVRNLAANRESIRDLPGVARLAGCLAPPGGDAFPVLLVAAGPSLDKLGPLIPAFAERCVTVAVDTSQRFLLKAGVAPDFTVVVDPQYWNARHLDRAPAPKTCLIAESAVYPPVLRGFPPKPGSSPPFARAFLCGSLFPLGRFIEDRVDPKGQLGAGGSVTTTAWDFARTLGPSAIWIAGLDLAFPGLKTHFKGALFEERSLAESARFIPPETWSVNFLRSGHPFFAPAADGTRVLTDRRLSLYSAWFEHRFRQYPEIQNRGLSPGGLAIAGLEGADPRELLSLPVRRDEINRRLRSVFTRVEEEFHRPPEAAVRAEKYRAALGELLRGLAHVKALAEAAAENAEGGLRQTRRPGTGPEALLKKLDETNRAIAASAVKDVAGFLFPPAAELEAGLQSPTSEGLRRYLEFSGKLYRSLAEAAAYNLSALNAVLDPRVKTRE
ncbi:MAG: DUF115 domain-containing protein [Spirochaetaceae bacterium]|jgi:hypothetical protein|nr:DUF115 domain-containing protein [Spirochaetaceae bacterium]